MSAHPSRRDGAQRWASIVVGALVIGLVGWMTVEGLNPSGRPTRRNSDSDAASPASSSMLTSTATADASASMGTATADLDAGLFMPTLSLGDGGPVTAMPSSAPRSVKLGVVLVTWAGAEGAPSNARSKKDAQTIAERLGAEARTDFHHAVTGGDPGSADDIGRLPRGVLDPHTEVAVFGLASGEVSDVLETPRGYWIVKRVD